MLFVALVYALVNASRRSKERDDSRECFDSIVTLTHLPLHWRVLYYPTVTASPIAIPVLH